MPLKLTWELKIGFKKRNHDAPSNTTLNLNDPMLALLMGEGLNIFTKPNQERRRNIDYYHRANLCFNEASN